MTTLIIKKMTNQELINVFKTSYKNEFDKHFEMANTFYDKARDKKYAVEMGLSIMLFLFAFRNSSELEKEIMDMYVHVYKLGGSVADMIRSIPSIIDRHKEKAKEWHETNKNNVSVEFKKFLGVIPYAIKKINVKSTMRMGSPFESLTTEREIAAEFGRQRAIIDLIDQLKVKYKIEGGNSYIEENNLLPIEFQSLAKLKVSLSKNDLDQFFKLIQGVFATMSYNMKITEGYFHSHIHFLLTLLDFNIESEIETNKGRIDSVIETENYLHIIEFKQNDSSIAIDQIKKKEYYQKYFNTSKKIILVGVAVDTEERNIISWTMQSYDYYIN